MYPACIHMHLTCCEKIRSLSMYPACILHVSCMYLTGYIKIHQDTSIKRTSCSSSMYRIAMGYSLPTRRSPLDRRRSMSIEPRARWSSGLLPCLAAMSRVEAGSETLAPPWQQARGRVSSVSPAPTPICNPLVAWHMAWQADVRGPSALGVLMSTPTPAAEGGSEGVKIATAKKSF